MIKKIVDYINDNKLKIRYSENMVNVINYDNILEIKEDIITIKYNNKIILIKGHDLKLNKLLDDELLITGIITKIEL